MGLLSGSTYRPSRCTELTALALPETAPAGSRRWAGATGHTWAKHSVGWRREGLFRRPTVHRYELKSS